MKPRDLLMFVIVAMRRIDWPKVLFWTWIAIMTACNLGGPDGFLVEPDYDKAAREWAAMPDAPPASLDDLLHRCRPSGMTLAGEPCI